MIKFNTKKYSVKKSIDGKGEAIPKYIIHVVFQRLYEMYFLAQR